MNVSAIFFNIRGFFEKLMFVEILRVNCIGKRKNYSTNNRIYYIPISVTPFELYMYFLWPSDTKRWIRLTFSDSASLFLKTRLMT